MPAAYGEISVILTHQSTGLSRRLVNLEKDPPWLVKLSDGKLENARYVDLKSFATNAIDLPKITSKYKKNELLVIDSAEIMFEEKTEYLLFQLLELRRKKDVKLLLAAQSNIFRQENQTLFSTSLPFIPNIHFFPLMNIQVTQDFIFHMSKHWEKEIEESAILKIANSSGGMMLITKKMAWDYSNGYQHEIKNNILYESLRWLLTNVWLSFSEEEKNCLLQIAWNKPIDYQKHISAIQYLESLNIVELKQIIKINIPVLEEYIKKYTNDPFIQTSSRGNINIDGINVEQKLTKIQYKIIKNLLKKNGEMIGRSELIEEVWQDEENTPSDWALDGQICRLRKRLKEIGVKGSKILTKKNQGYIWQN